ncbi:hypothetical protein B0H10DRAFT_1940347 [Mycena sp. CBHHK59/15]|nr:hypothetical protein B0H10DRAFT_1940347 [Mycena sp. CBHHK59/15]
MEGSCFGDMVLVNDGLAVSKGVLDSRRMALAILKIGPLGANIAGASIVSSRTDLNQIMWVTKLCIMSAVEQRVTPGRTLMLSGVSFTSRAQALLGRTARPTRPQSCQNLAPESVQSLRNIATHRETNAGSEERYCWNSTLSSRSSDKAGAKNWTPPDGISHMIHHWTAAKQCSGHEIVCLLHLLYQAQEGKFRTPKIELELQQSCRIWVKGSAGTLVHRATNLNGAKVCDEGGRKKMKIQLHGEKTSTGANERGGFH